MLLSMTVGEDLENGGEWIVSIIAKDNCACGMPSNVTHVVQFDPSNVTLTVIGEECNGEAKWHGGCLAADGNSHTAPHCSRRVLKNAIPWWGIVKEQIVHRWLVTQERASAINLGKEKIGLSFHQNFIECFNDNIFCMILKFLCQTNLHTRVHRINELRE